MSKELINIYGPISIQGFGFMVSLGLIVFVLLVYNNKKRKELLNDDQFSTVIFVGIFSGIIGGRILYIAQEYNSISGIIEMLSFWKGGFSILGTIIATITAITLYLKKIKIPIFPVFDLLALYAPLAQSISRIGCFIAGCCYGTPSSLFWAIKSEYISATNIICTRLHPTQLYSSFLLLAIFVFIRFFATKIVSKQGQLMTLYLSLAGTERFIIDFWRGDRAFFKWKSLNFLSIHQWIGLSVGIISLIAFLSITLYSKNKKT